jgi:hypothetical protein
VCGLLTRRLAVWGLLTGPLGMVLRLTRFVRIRGYGHGATLGAVRQASHWRQDRLTRSSDGYQAGSTLGG